MPGIKKAKVAATATKARHILGLGPISYKTIDFHLKQSTNYKEAKKAAVHEYLAYFLNYTEEELKHIAIAETSVAPNDDIIYTAFEDPQDIKEIHTQVAECGNPAITTRGFIPPQFYQRYMHMSRMCKDLRAENPDTKTQLCFNDKDIELLIKEKGSDEPFKVINTEDYMDPMAIPDFDHTKNWVFRGDKPPRRRIEYAINKKTLPSTEQDITKSQPPTHRQTGLQLPIARKNSLNNHPSKKQKTDEDTPMIDVSHDESI